MQIIGLDTGHCKRVACLGILMGKEAGFRDEELRDFAGCCILHDNALTEFIHEELSNGIMPHDLSAQFSDIIDPGASELNHKHCVIGEKKANLMVLQTAKARSKSARTLRRRIAFLICAIRSGTITN